MLIIFLPYMNMISFIIEKYETEGWQKIVYTIFFIFTQNEQSKYFLLLINSRHYSFVGFHWVNNEYFNLELRIKLELRIVNSRTLYSYSISFYNIKWYVWIIQKSWLWKKEISKYYHITVHRITYHYQLLSCVSN